MDSPSTGLPTLDLPQPLLERALASLWTLARICNVAPIDFEPWADDRLDWMLGEGADPDYIERLRSYVWRVMT